MWWISLKVNKRFSDWPQWNSSVPSGQWYSRSQWYLRSIHVPSSHLNSSSVQSLGGGLVGAALHHTRGHTQRHTTTHRQTHADIIVDTVGYTHVAYHSQSAEAWIDQQGQWSQTRVCGIVASNASLSTTTQRRFCEFGVIYLLTHRLKTKIMLWWFLVFLFLNSSNRNKK